MPRKGLFIPKLHDRNVRRLYHHAHRFSMPVSQLLNLIVSVGLEELSQVNDPHEYFVPSETEAGKVYRVYTHLDPWKRTCPGHLKHHHCKHTEMVKEYLAEMEGGREVEEGENHADGVSNMVIPPPPTQNGLSKWIVTLHGKETMRYQGLLAMAHEQGLVSLSAKFVSITADLTVATAFAIFEEDRKFFEAAEATPTNVQAGVRHSWARMALTRAKARVLRDALNIGMVSAEELEE